jgi:threonine dehydrogenase-like Zn-dependent dehydrogenase
MGAKNIILVGLEADKKNKSDVAAEMGATYFVASDVEDLNEVVNKVCGPEGAAVAIDCAGAPIVLKQAIANVQKEGRIIKVGVSNAPINFPLTDFTFKAITLKGHHAYDVASWRNCLGLLEKGMLNLEPLITHRLPLEEWETGMHLMKNQEAIKIILTP